MSKKSKEAISDIHIKVEESTKLEFHGNCVNEGTNMTEVLTKGIRKFNDIRRKKTK